MEKTTETQTHQTAEIEAFVMAPEEAQTLTEVDIANRKAEFYKNLLKGERAKKEKITTQEKPAPSEFDAKALEERVGLRLSGHTEDEVHFMDGVAKGLGIPLSKAKENPFVTAALEARRAKAQADAATLEPSGKTTVTTKDTPFNSLSADDKKKNYAATMDALLSKAKQK